MAAFDARSLAPFLVSHASTLNRVAMLLRVPIGEVDYNASANDLASQPNPVFGILEMLMAHSPLAATRPELQSDMVPAAVVCSNSAGAMQHSASSGPPSAPAPPSAKAAPLETRVISATPCLIEPDGPLWGPNDNECREMASLVSHTMRKIWGCSVYGDHAVEDMRLDLDTGAQMSLAHEAAVDRAWPGLARGGARIVELEQPMVIHSMGGVYYCHRVLKDACIQIGRGVYCFQFLIAEDLPCDWLVGMDYMCYFGVRLNYTRHMARLCLRRRQLAPGCSLPVDKNGKEMTIQWVPTFGTTKQYFIPCEEIT
jgi:hypothetical protein